MIPGAFDYYAPASLEEALSLLSRHGHEAKLLAGGQSLVPLMKLRLSKPQVIVDIGGVPGLDGIRQESSNILIGARTTYHQLEQSDLLKTQCPLLPQTANMVADVQVRNQGTVGGALAHADPAADLPATMLALDAGIKLTGPTGERWVQAEDFFITMLMTALSSDEILTEVRVPILEQTKTTYLKAAKRAEGFAIVGVAAALRVDASGNCQNLRLGLTGVSDKAFRAKNVEHLVTGKRIDDTLIKQASAVVVDGVEVADDMNASADYRSHLARVYTARALESLSGSR
ncbi:MAG: xanthine dehydrogenase family protein subunit M [Deltaproteobacteria bacterium]|nr:xanthine dehydrogenase family protein subunit M [Deltaproteobacteria bacterium]